MEHADELITRALRRVAREGTERRNEEAEGSAAEEMTESLYTAAGGAAGGVVPRHGVIRPSRGEGGGRGG